MTRTSVSVVAWLALALSLAGCSPVDGLKSNASAVTDTIRGGVPSVPWLADAPTAETFVAPGIRGLTAELRARAARKHGSICPAGVKFSPTNGRLAPYTRYKSPDTPANPALFNIRQIVVKLIEGSGVRLRGRQLRQVDVSADTRGRLARSGLKNAEVLRELTALNKAVVSMHAVIGRAAPFVDEEDLVRLHRCAESHSRRELPDLNLFYFVHLPEIDSKSAEKYLDRLRALRIVEVAYFQPIPFDAADIPPLTTVDVTPSQGYFHRSPGGIDVDWARHFRSGRGNASRIVDIENGWNLTHEDLPPPTFGFGVNWGNLASGNHGAAVLGELVAEENGFGANGIAPNSEFGWSSTTNLDPSGAIYFYSVGSALLSAQRFLRPGDIALIEQQFDTGSEGFIRTTPPPAPCPKDLPGYVAVEEYAAEHAAITNITHAGIVVVEAAGNGRTKVTPASTADSGAIVVGASDDVRGPACFSNFGPRVDVQGWGTDVGTTGYGGSSTVADPAMRANGADATQWYTQTFEGTSAASPIVAGAAAIIQSTREEAGLPQLNSFDMRTLLASTGTPQATGSSPNIGPQPDLRRAIASYLPDAARFVSQTRPPSVVTPGQIFINTVKFANSGGVVWGSDHTLSAAPSSQTGLPTFLGGPFHLGPPGPDVFPDGEVLRDLTITSPTQPGTYNFTIVLKNGAGQRLASSPTQQIVVAAPNSTFDDARITITSAPNSLSTGQSATVTVQVTNAGTSTWTPSAYSIGLQRGFSIFLTQQSLSLPGSFGPGGALSVPFTIKCDHPGTGWFSVQMRGPSGAFGQLAGHTVVCQ